MRLFNLNGEPLTQEAAEFLYFSNTYSSSSQDQASQQNLERITGSDNSNNNNSIFHNNSNSNKTYPTLQKGKQPFYSWSTSETTMKIRNIVGTLPIKVVNNETFVLLVTSRGTANTENCTSSRSNAMDANCFCDVRVAPHYWILPKGGHKKSKETPEEGALRETMEEAGVTGYVTRKVCEIIAKDGGKWSWFEMQVTNEHAEWPEMHQRIRSWVNLFRVYCLRV